MGDLGAVEGSGWGCHDPGASGATGLGNVDGGEVLEGSLGADLVGLDQVRVAAAVGSTFVADFPARGWVGGGALGVLLIVADTDVVLIGQLVLVPLPARIDHDAVCVVEQLRNLISDR